MTFQLFSVDVAGSARLGRGNRGCVICAFASCSGGGGNTSTGTDADSSKVNASDKQYDGRSGMATFTIAKGGLMYEATLGGQKFKYEPL